MDLSAFPLPDAWAVLAWVVAVPMFAVAFARVHWRAVADGPAARLWPAAVAALIGLWSIRAHVGSHLAFHLSGIAALTLACGAPLALVGGAVVVGASIAWSGANPANAAAAWLAGVALPALVVTAVRHAAAAWLPRNLFVFVFVVAYFGAAIVNHGWINRNALRVAFALFLIYVASNMLFRPGGRARSALEVTIMVAIFAVTYLVMRLLGRRYREMPNWGEIYRNKLRHSTPYDFEI